MHVCQISKDFTLLNWDENCEPVQRQLSYMEQFKQTYVDAQMTIVVLHNTTFAQTITKKDIQIIPVRNSFYNRIVKVFFVLKRVEKANPVNVVTCQNPYDEAWPTLLFSKLYNVPSIAQIHMDIFTVEARHELLGNSLLGRIRFWLFKRLTRYFAAIRVVGTRIKKNLINQSLADPKRIFVLPVTVPLVGVKTSPKAPYVPGNSLSILFVGRLVSPKNLFFWLDVASKIINDFPTVTFDIVGDGHLKSALQQYAKELKIENHVHFHGEVKNDLLGEYYKKADIFLLTSHYEGFGRVILEAGSFGLPVISTQVTGPEDIIIQEYNGYLFKPGDIDGIVKCALELLNDPAKRLELGMNNQKHVTEKFQPAKLKREWVELWISICKNRPK